MIASLAGCTGISVDLGEEVLGVLGFVGIHVRIIEELGYCLTVVESGVVVNQFPPCTARRRKYH